MNRRDSRDSMTNSNIRTTTIRVHGGKELELFVQERVKSFELWTVGTTEGKRQILDHHRTNDDLEKRLYYQRPGDLRWTEAFQTQIPKEKHASAIEMEATIKRRKYINHPSTVAHLGYGSVDLLGMDRKTLNAARKAIQGRWTDGHMTCILGPDNHLELSGETEAHVLNSGWPSTSPIRDWWNFGHWRFHTMNIETKVGQMIAVVHVDERELHFYSIHPDQIAHVFRRVP